MGDDELKDGLAVKIFSAKNLIKGACFATIRVGPAGCAWDAKKNCLFAKTETKEDTSDPEWLEDVHLIATGVEKPELHVQVTVGDAAVAEARMELGDAKRSSGVEEIALAALEGDKEGMTVSLSWKRVDPDESIGYVLPPGLGGVRLVGAYGHSSPGGGA